MAVDASKQRIYLQSGLGWKAALDLASGGPLTRFSGSAPGAAAGANAGATPPAPVVAASATDGVGTLTFGTGTTPAAGAQVVVTFAKAFDAAPFVIIQEQNSATAALNTYVSSVSTTGFTISTQGAPAASQANTVYAVGFLVIGA